jgi:transposase InsO family protein
LLNERVLPFFDEHEVKLLRVLTDRGSEFCGNPERHEYELYLAVEDIDHSRTKTKSTQTNGICERFAKTVLNEFYRVAFRKKVYRSIDELQADLDSWFAEYNEVSPDALARAGLSVCLRGFLRRLATSLHRSRAQHLAYARDSFASGDRW